MNFKELYETNQQKYFSLWKEYLRIKSISTDGAYRDDCLAAAEWVKDLLVSFGFSAKLMDTPTLPLVTAEHLSDPKLPTVLIYGHYDVQPVDPLNLWHSDPFEPEIRGPRMYARGAVDNKGQTLPVLLALGELKKSGKLNCNVKIIMEGEEECGSAGLTAVMDQMSRDFKADVLMVSDTGTLSPELPCITLGLRGIVQFEAVLSGPAQDLHSGIHGGIARNPATELARIVARLHDANGRIAIPGFYDDVVEISAAEKQAANRITITAEQYAQSAGVAPAGGEVDYTIAERRGLRPTIEVNGFHSGYGGEGGKTIIPSVASVKISSRLVRGQEPQKVLDCIISFFKQHTPTDLKLKIINEVAAGACIFVSPDNKYIRLAQDVLKNNYGTDAACLWEGGSIPVLAKLIEATGAAPVFVGFECIQDLSHSPNESFLLDQFQRSFMYAGAYLENLGSLK